MRGLLFSLLLGVSAFAHEAGLATVRKEDLTRHIGVLAAPEREGRDSPSAGLEEAAQYIGEVFANAGVEPLADSAEFWKANSQRELRPAPAAAAASGEARPSTGTYLRPFTRRLPKADLRNCYLRLDPGSGTPRSFEYGKDFVALPHANGEVAGELVFVGFGIESRAEGYLELQGLKLEGKLAVLVEGEPRHPKRFDGAELTSAAALWNKLRDLREARAAGALVVRRSYGPPDGGKYTPAGDSLRLEQPGLRMRHTFAEWVGTEPDARPRESLPALEISEAAASELLGFDVAAWAAKTDRTPKVARPKLERRRALFQCKTSDSEVEIDNVVGRITGTDPALADQWVVIGAHYDHIGVDVRGRVGYGADDNGSGTSALLELAEALCASRPRRSVLICGFGGEEDGLLGSRALTQRLPVPKEKLVAMINMDMIGRGDPAEVAVIGITQNPALEKVLERARKLSPTGVQKLVLRQGEELFARSDHHSFHQIGVPVLFFFEGLPIERNPDYHTWRDTVDKLDMEKIRRTSILVYNTTWLLANDDDRPPPPRE